VAVFGLQLGKITTYPPVQFSESRSLNPYAYLNYLFEKLPNLDFRDDATLDQLLPWNVKPQ